MEPAQKIIEHISCPLHKERIRRIGIDKTDELSLLCVGCIENLEGNKFQERYILENFLHQIAENHKQVPKLQQLPDSTNQILNTEDEIVANFSYHIEKQKEQVNVVFDKLRQSFNQTLENKKRQLIADLESQLKLLENVFAFYKQKVLCYKNESQETVLTFEKMYQEVSKITNVTDLKKLLVAHHDNMKNNEIFAGMDSEEAKRIVVLDALKAMDTQILKTQTAKPIVSFGSNHGNLEDLLKIWNEQVDNVIHGFKIEIKDPVKNLEFKLPRPTNFDSMILSNDPRSKKMVADWVLETIKSNRCQLYLLYRGSRDGFRAKNFHEKCDNRGPTVVLIENTTGNKFGGYASVSWTGGSNSGLAVDIKSEESKSSFLFSVDKKQKLLYKPESKSRTLFHSADYGPCFGGSSTLGIYDNCNTRNDNYYIATCKSYQSLKEGGSIAGNEKFTVKEIEIYSLSL